SGLFQELTAFITELEQRFHFAAKRHIVSTRFIQEYGSLLYRAIDGAFEHFRRQNGAFVSHKVLRGQAVDSATPWRTASRAGRFWSRHLKFRRSLLCLGRQRI